MPMAQEEKRQIERALAAVADCLRGESPRVAGPVSVIMLTEIARAQEMPLDTLLAAVRQQYELATGDLFNKATD